MEDLAEAMTGYGRVIEYRAYSSYFAPDSCKIERVKEGKVKHGKMEGYARKFTGLKGGNCFVGFFKEGKPDGLFLSWYENGQKLAELNFKEGKNVGIYVEWHENGQKAREGMVENEDSQKSWNSKGESVNSFEETGLK